MAENIKDKITLWTGIILFLLTIAGYGVYYGKLSQRVDNLETRTNKIETIVEDKLDILTKVVSQQTVSIAVLAEKVEQLNQRMNNK